MAIGKDLWTAGETANIFYHLYGGSMKTKIFCTVLTLLLVASISFARPQAETGAKAGMYGGTLTIAHTGSKGDPASPAQDDTQVGSIANWGGAVWEHLIIGDMAKWGKMGNGEFPFEVSDYIPDKYVKGQMLEGWDVTPQRAELYLKKGIKWYADHVNWMETREVTAEDIAFDINKFWHNPWGKRFNGVLAKDAYAKDKYTVVCEFETFNNQFLYYIGWEDRAAYTPPELEDNDPKVWTNQVGSGPFWIESYTPGVSMVYKKNPVYYDTTVIDGKEYQMPFVDTMIQPIIPDDATRLAAFRTGKIDWYSGPSSNLWDDYEAIGDGVNMDSFNNGNGKVVWMNNKVEPFNNPDVRRALSVGTDRMPIAKLIRSEDLPIRYWPQPPNTPGFVPDNKLPADVAQLWKYDVNKAKQMLAEAGYPNGFKTEMMVRSEALNQDIGAILQEQWRKIGVETTINVQQPAAFDRDVYAVEYKGVAIPDGFDAANPIAVLSSEGLTGEYYNIAGYSNLEYDRVVKELLQEFDLDRQNELIKEASLIIMKDAAYLPLAVKAYRVYWWDWVKNYFGEFSLSDGGKHAMMAYVWLDQERKKALGF
jgi:peptide/nickel transport system substrate-binding protein